MSRSTTIAQVARGGESDVWLQAMLLRVTDPRSLIARAICWVIRGFSAAGYFEF